MYQMTIMPAAPTPEHAAGAPRVIGMLAPPLATARPAMLTA